MCASAYGARGDVIYVSCRGKPTRRDDVDAPERRHVATADALTKEGNLLRVSTPSSASLVLEGSG